MTRLKVIKIAIKNLSKLDLMPDVSNLIQRSNSDLEIWTSLKLFLYCDLSKSKDFLL